MTVTLKHEVGSKVLIVHVRETLEKNDLEQLAAEFEQAIINNKKTRVLFEMDEFSGWESDALWEQLKIDFKHFGDVERIAMVGDKQWEQAMAIISKPFTTATVRYFDVTQHHDAVQWIYEGMPVPAEQSSAF